MESWYILQTSSSINLEGYDVDANWLALFMTKVYNWIIHLPLWKSSTIEL